MRRAVLITIAVVAAAGLSDLVVRVVALAEWHLALHRYPSIEKRYVEADRTTPRWTRSMIEDLPTIPLPYVKPNGEAPEWLPVRQIPRAAFRTVPASDDLVAGRVRIMFLGGSTTYSGYPEIVGRLLNGRFGEGKVEVINLGLNAASTEAVLELARMYVPLWRPSLVVMYGAFNDIVLDTILALLPPVEPGADRDEAVPIVAGPPSRGLVAWLTGGGDPAAPWVPPERILDRPRRAYHDLARFCRQHGAELLVSTFAAPAYASISVEDREFLEADIRFLWPMLRSTAAYEKSLAAYRAMVREVAVAEGVGVIDVAGGLVGGLDVFLDNCHATDKGKNLHAAIVASAIEPRVGALLEKGAPVTVDRPGP
jgi:hypothetical protein